MALNIPYLITTFNISLSMDGKHYCVTKAQESKRYDELKEAIKNQDEALVREILIPKVRVVRYATEYFEVDEKGDMYMKDRPAEKVGKVIARRLIDFSKDKLPIEPIVNFWKRLRENPSEKSKNQLFGFLEANFHPLTPEGNFLAYKKVTSIDGKLFDSNTKTLDNSIGKVVEMPREKVDADENRTCSTGLHVAAWSYAHNFSGNVFIEVIIDPKDVVAVPIDYNQQKMRVCKYKVVGVVGYDNPRKEHVSTNIDESEMEKTNEPTVVGTDKKVSFVAKTAKEIIQIVKDLTDTEITMSLKNKQPIVKKAVKMLGDAGFTVIEQ